MLDPSNNVTSDNHFDTLLKFLKKQEDILERLEQLKVTAAPYSVERRQMIKNMHRQDLLRKTIMNNHALCAATASTGTKSTSVKDLGDFRCPKKSPQSSILVCVRGVSALIRELMDARIPTYAKIKNAGGEALLTIFSFCVRAENTGGGGRTQ